MFKVFDPEVDDFAEILPTTEELEELELDLAAHANPGGLEELEEFFADVLSGAFPEGEAA